MINTNVATDLLGKEVSIYEEPSRFGSYQPGMFFKGRGVVRAVFVKDTDVWLVVAIRSDASGNYAHLEEKREDIGPLRKGKAFSFLAYADMSRQTIVVEDEP